MYSNDCIFSLCLPASSGFHVWAPHTVIAVVLKLAVGWFMELVIKSLFVPANLSVLHL